LQITIRNDLCVTYYERLKKSIEIIPSFKYYEREIKTFARFRVKFKNYVQLYNNYVIYDVFKPMVKYSLFLEVAYTTVIIYIITNLK
jgi:hypothetical protein